MNFFIKTKGSVSIFLIIILVPMIAITTIFIDASRIKLAQGLADTVAEGYFRERHRMVTIRQAFAFTADAVKSGRLNRQKSHCEAILDGFLP